MKRRRFAYGPRPAASANLQAEIARLNKRLAQDAATERNLVDRAVAEMLGAKPKEKQNRKKLRGKPDKHEQEREEEHKQAEEPKAAEEDDEFLLRD